MAEIVFINPPLSLEERYGDLAKGGTETPPLGLAQLAAVVREKGHKVSIIDCAALGLGYKDTVSKVKGSGVKIIGLTAVTISVHNAGKLAEELKKDILDATIILGGPHITSVPEKTMNMFPYVDMGVIGEGEITVVELLDALQQGKELKDVNGLVYRQDGKLKYTAPRAMIHDLDQLPMPAWDLLPDLVKYYETPTFNFGKTPASSLITSRGCYGQCTFCDRKVFGNICRSHSAERIFEMMKHLHEKYGINDIIIHDDTFIVFKPRVEKVCNMLIESGLGITWECNARVDLVNPDLLKLMRKAGCWQIGYGIESGSQRILDTIKKGTKLEQIRKAVTWTHEAGIRTRGFFMIGHPTENEESIKETIKFAKSIPVDDFQITFFTPLPGSEVYNHATEYGQFEDDWTKMNMWGPVFVVKDLTREKLIYWHKRAFREFYLRPRVVWSYLKMIRSPGHVMKLFKGAFTLLKEMVRGK